MLSVQPWDDFSDYDDRPYETVQRSFRKIDPMTVIGSVIPSYYQWVQRLPSEIKEPYLKSILEDLARFSENEIRWAAERVRSSAVWPKYDQMGEAICKEAAVVRAKSATRSLERSIGPVLTCLYCGDASGQATGYVEAYLPQVVKRYQEGDLPLRYGGTLVEYTAVWRCPCAAGDATSKDRRGEYRLALFDPKRHVRVVERDLPIDVAIFHGEIEPVRVEIDGRRCKTLSDALRIYGPVLDAEYAQRRRQLGLPERKRRANRTLSKTAQQAVAPVQSPPKPAPVPPEPEEDAVPF